MPAGTAMGAPAPERVQTLAGPRLRVVCATGPRPQHLAEAGRAFAREKLLRAAEYARDVHGCEVGLSGMALGPDLWWADAVVRAGLILGAHVPCPQQPDRWKDPADRREWQRLLDLADPAHTVPKYADRYSPRAMHLRNKGMLAAADGIVCVWIADKCTGGTWDAVQIAHRAGLGGVAHIDPEAGIVRRGLPQMPSDWRP